MYSRKHWWDKTSVYSAIRLFGREKFGEWPNNHKWISLREKTLWLFVNNSAVFTSTYVVTTSKVS